MPELDELVVDERRRRVERTGRPLLLNPFDARALAVALALRREGEPIVALSMGPPEAETVLREALAAGVDRAVLLCDPALAGSDAQVTATVLATALRDLGGELVLAGSRTTDAETGQVPIELAERLGRPVVTSARRIERAPTGNELLVEADAGDGWERLRLTTPAVISTGEKIAKPPRPSEESRARAAWRPIERWDLGRLGIPPAAVGDAGSPTVVVALRPDAPVRAPRRYFEGPVDDRVGQAFAELDRPGFTAGEVAQAAPSGDADRGGAAASEGWALVTDEDGRLDEPALSLLAGLRRTFPRDRAVALAFGPTLSGDEVGRLGGAGADEVRHFPGTVTPEGVARALSAASAGPSPPSCGLFLAEPFAREAAARWAAATGLGLVADATALRRGEGGALLCSKPAFGGGYEVDVAGRVFPTLATVRPGALAPPVAASPRPVAVTEGPPIPSAPRRPVRLDRGSERVAAYGSLETARRVVTVGLGIGGPEGIARLVPYLARWGAALGATRRVVDAGWVPPRYQIGLTGRSVAPALALLLGVGKATNHVIGLRRAGRLVAVNSDPEAPVFRYVDAGILADWQEALPALDRGLAGPAGGAY